VAQLFTHVFELIQHGNGLRKENFFSKEITTADYLYKDTRLQNCFYCPFLCSFLTTFAKDSPLEKTVSGTSTMDKRVMSTLFMVGSQVSFPLVLEANRLFTGRHIDTSLSIFGVELLKMIICAVILAPMWLQGSVEISFNPNLSGILCIPALIYYINNSLSFLIMRFITSAQFIVLQQVKVITTAFCMYVALGKKLSAQQWCSLILLTVACAISQMPQLTMTKSLKDEFHSAGVVLTLIQAHLSAFAAVFTERLLKGYKQPVL